MNSLQQREGMTLSTWLHLTLAVATSLPVSALVIVALVGVTSLPPSVAGAFVTVCLVCAIVIVSSVTAMYYLLRKRLDAWALQLVDLCREYAGGARTVRAPVSGNDVFALLAMSLNSLLDSQDIDEEDPASVVLGFRENSMTALQAQVERLLHAVTEVGTDSEQGYSSHGIGVLAETFAHLIETLAEIIGHVQDASVHMTTTTHEVESAWNRLTIERDGQLVRLGEHAEAVGSFVAFLQHGELQAEHAVEVAGDVEAQGMASKRAIYQSLEALYGIQENLAATAQRVSELDRLASEIAQAMQGLNTLDGHLALLSSKDTIESAEAKAVHPVVEADLSYLSQTTTSLAGRLTSLTRQLQREARSAAELIATSTSEVAQGTSLVGEVGRQLSGLALDVSRQAQMVTEWSAEAFHEAGQARAQGSALEQLFEQMHRTQSAMQLLQGGLTRLSDLSERLHASVRLASTPELQKPTVEHAAVPSLTALTRRASGS